MKENIFGRTVECRNCADGYAICVDGNQVWWVDYGSRLSEKEAEIAFSAIVSALNHIGEFSETAVVKNGVAP